MRWQKQQPKAKPLPKPPKEPKPDLRLQWHRWFAWHWITVGQTRVWLETVYRKGKIVGVDGYHGYENVIEWEYNLEGHM